MIVPPRRPLGHRQEPRHTGAGGDRRFGFTERQARFLVTVMLHSGVFVERQYCAFAGIVHGQKTHDFIEQLVSARVRAARSGPARSIAGGSITSTTSALYAAIGEPDNRNRKQAPLGRMVERLMVLDAVLDDRNLRGLAPKPTSVATSNRCLQGTARTEELPHLTFGEGAVADAAVLPRQAADRRRAGRHRTRVPVPGHAAHADGLPRVPGAARELLRRCCIGGRFGCWSRSRSPRRYRCSGTRPARRSRRPINPLGRRAEVVLSSSATGGGHRRRSRGTHASVDAASSSARRASALLYRALDSSRA